MSVVVKGQRATIKVGPWVLGKRFLDLHVEASTTTEFVHVHVAVS